MRRITLPGYLNPSFECSHGLSIKRRVRNADFSGDDDRRSHGLRRPGSRTR
jgi:hypothetical protein